MLYESFISDHQHLSSLSLWWKMGTKKDLIHTESCSFHQTAGFFFAHMKYMYIHTNLHPVCCTTCMNTSLCVFNEHRKMRKAMPWKINAQINPFVCVCCCEKEGSFTLRMVETCRGQRSPQCCSWLFPEWDLQPWVTCPAETKGGWGLEVWGCMAWILILCVCVYWFLWFILPFYMFTHWPYWDLWGISGQHPVPLIWRALLHSLRSKTYKFSFSLKVLIYPYPWLVVYRTALLLVGVCIALSYTFLIH